MIKNFFLFLIIFFILLSSYNLSAQYAGGDGSAGNPYQIATTSQLEHLMATSSDWSSHFVLTADIDMNSLSANPIGNSSTNFTGTFNGRSYVIRNLNINNPGADDQGLFGYISNSTITNLGITNAYINGQNTQGILCGTATLSSISNCYATGTVQGASIIGGFIGDNSISSITNCYFNGTVEGADYIGGFCGENNIFSSISNCYSNGSVDGDEAVGGFCGITNQSSINNCYSTCNVSGNYRIGGFCGYNYNISSISNCYAIGNVQGSNVVGGFCGLNFFCTIEYCYSIGKPTGSTNVGGFIGDSFNGIQNCNFWNKETSELNNAVGTGNSSGITGLTTIQFQNANSFSPCFDFDNDWVMGFYVKDSNYLFPMLRSFSYVIIPTLTEWAAFLFISLLAVIGSWFVWRKLV